MSRSSQHNLVFFELFGSLEYSWSILLIPTLQANVPLSATAHFENQAIHRTPSQIGTTCSVSSVCHAEQDASLISILHANLARCTVLTM